MGIVVMSIITWVSPLRAHSAPSTRAPRTAGAVCKLQCSCAGLGVSRTHVSLSLQPSPLAVPSPPPSHLP